MCRRLLLCHLLLAIVPAAATAAEDAGVEFFEKKIRPVLVEKCYQCHRAKLNQDKKNSMWLGARGGLSLDSRSGILKGGESGPALVPGKPDASLLIKAVRYTDPELRMPPKGKLPAAAIADLEKWVAMGAPDPRAGAAAETARKEVDVEKGRQFWAFQPPRKHAVPGVKDGTWPRGPIDRFILARLESKQLRPAGDADRATLLRRAYFDLVGLPPTPAQVDAFVQDRSPDAFARAVDQLLASPHFGERWGRHWLDVARFAESSGGGRSLLLKDAWRYRDYVIKAFNDDRPYNRFLIEQLAGDLLPHRTPEQRDQQIIATAFLLLGPTNYEEQDKPVLEMDVIDEQLDTIGKAVLGLTLGCARCHDHKFDPIPTRDYYALAGIFKSTRLLVHDNVSRWMEQPLPMTAAQELVVTKHETMIAALKAKIQLARDTAKKAGKPEQLQAELKRLLASGPERPMAMAVSDAIKVEDCQICIRGNFHNRGERVPPGFLQVLTRPGPPDSDRLIPADQSGRRQLAAWLASPDNPLTARVMVNRIWHHLFGAGLVRTVDNFGSMGEAPSHPELLDYLAVRFVEEGWSVKKLIRAIVLSHAYQQSVEADAVAKSQQVDPENRLLWHANRRRLDAEAIRDAILAVSGQLDRTAGGPTIARNTIERDYRFDDTRRSIYTPILRNKLLELFEVFDFPDPNICLGKRNVSTVPTQALYLMNSPFAMNQAEAAAQALLAVPDLDDAGRVDRAYRLALGRLPSARERQFALAFVGQAPAQRLQAWERFCQTLFACLDFRYVN